MGAVILLHPTITPTTPSPQGPSAMANLVELAEELGARTPFTGGEEEELEQRRQGGPS